LSVEEPSFDWVDHISIARGKWSCTKGALSQTQANVLSSLVL